MKRTIYTFIAILLAAPCLAQSGVANRISGKQIIDGTIPPAKATSAAAWRVGLGLGDAATATIGVGVPSSTGTGASGTWPISITGNAATATTATSATTAGDLTGTHADPAWLTSVAASKLTGANTLPNGVLPTTMALGTTATPGKLQWTPTTAGGHAPFQIAYSDGFVFDDGVVDPVLLWGYNHNVNSSPIDATEPMLGWGLEADYYHSGRHDMEHYLQYFSANGKHAQMRTIFFAYDRAAGNARDALVSAEILGNPLVISRPSASADAMQADPSAQIEGNAIRVFSHTGTGAALSLGYNGNVNASTIHATATGLAFDANGGPLNVAINGDVTANNYVTAGKVGIGSTDTPPYPLTVDGVMRLRQSGGTRYRADLNVSGGQFNFTGFDDTGGAYIPLNFNGSGTNFKSSGTDVGSYNASGQWYLGGTTVTGLRVQGTDTANTLYKASGDMGITVQSGTLKLNASAVGIGTSGAPAATLSIGGTTGNFQVAGATGLITTGGWLRGSAALDFGSIAAAAQADLTITVTGATVGDCVSLGLPAAPAAGITFNAWVSATDTVSIRASNITAAPVDPASATYKVAVLKS